MPLDQKAYPILEYDGSSRAVLEPERCIEKADVAEHCVICFFRDAVEALIAEQSPRSVYTTRSETVDLPV